MLGSSLLTVVECSRNSKLPGTVSHLEQVPAPLLDLHMTQVSRRDPGCHCAVEDPLQGVQAWLMDAGCSRSFPKAADLGGEMLCSGAEITVAKKWCAGWAAGAVRQGREEGVGAAEDGGQGLGLMVP